MMSPVKEKQHIIAFRWDIMHAVFIFESFCQLNFRFVSFFQSKLKLQTERPCLHRCLTLRRPARHHPRDPNWRRVTSRAPAASLWPTPKSSARSWICRRALKSYVYHLLQVTKNTSVYLWWWDPSVLQGWFIHLFKNAPWRFVEPKLWKTQYNTLDQKLGMMRWCYSTLPSTFIQH